MDEGVVERLSLAALALDDCGGLLPDGVTAEKVFEAQRDSQQWIHRRVVSVRLREDGCTHVRTSLDMDLPSSLGNRCVKQGGRNRATIPITWLRKDIDTHRLDFRDGRGDSIPLVHSDQQAKLLVALLASIGASDGLVDIAPKEWEGITSDIASLVTERRLKVAAELARGVVSTWRRVGASDEAVARITALVEILKEEFLVALVVPIPTDGRRIVVKYAFGHGPTTAALALPRTVDPSVRPWILRRFRMALNAFVHFFERRRVFGNEWRAQASFVYRDPDLRLAKSTHFEFETSGETLVLRTGLVIEGKPIVRSQDRARTISRIEVRVAPLSDDVGSESVASEDANAVGGPFGLFVIHITPKKSALTGLAFYSAELGFLFYLLVWCASYLGYGATVDRATHPTVFGCLAERCLFSPEWTSTSNLDLFVPILSALLGAATIWASRSREHSIATWVLTPFRWVTFLTGLGLGISALSLAFVQFEYWWVPLIGSVIAQGYVAARESRIRRRVVRWGEDVSSRKLIDIVLDAQRAFFVPPTALSVQSIDITD